jgi:DNA-binding NtrC family response regulator
VKPLREAAREFERDYIALALIETKGVRLHAARLLGISRKTLWEKLKPEPQQEQKGPIDHGKE